MIRRTKSVLIPVALTLSALIPLAANAADPLSYSYIEGQYLNSTLKGDPQSSLNPSAKKDLNEGYRAALDISLYKFIYFSGEADNRRDTKYSFATQSVGLGAHTEPTFTKNLQLFAVASYERKLYDDVVGGLVRDDADEGFGAQGGVRIPYGNFEFTGAYRYLNYGKTNDLKVTGDKFGGGILVQLWPNFGLTADYRRFDLKYKGTGPAAGVHQEDQFSEWMVGFRSYFATDIDRSRRRGGFFGGGE